MKKLLILLFILILGSSCYAYTPNDVLAVLTILKDKGVISGLPTDYQGNSAWVGFTQSLGNTNNKGYAIVVTGNNNNNYYNNVVSLYAPRGNTIVNHNFYPNEWASYVDGVNWLSQYNFHNNMSNWNSGLLDSNKYNIIYAYTTIDINTNSLQLSAFEEYGGNYLSGSFEFNPTTTSGYINITANGVTESFIRRPFSYSVNNTRLGYISNPDDFYAIEGYLSYFIDISGDSNVLETIAGFTKNQNGIYSNNLFITSQGEITVKTSKLLNMQGVALYFRYKEDVNSSYEYSDEYYYYTYFYGTNPESGDLISPDLNSTADVGLVNALSDFFNTDSGESNVPYIINSVFPSGDVNFSGDFLPSGDIFGIPYVSYDNWGLGDFVVWTFKGFANAFTNYEDVTLNAGFLGNISTADFKLPQNAASSLIGFLANSFLLIRFLLWYWNLTITISTLDYEHLSGYEIDNNFFLF